MAYSREEAAELIIKAGYALVEKGLIARTWGNISARLSDTEFLVTPSGMGYDRLTPDKLVVCKISDCSYEGEIKPSSEKGVHGEAYKYRPDVNFVIHTHQLYATAVGTTGKSLSARTAEEEKILGGGCYQCKICDLIHQAFDAQCFGCHSEKYRKQCLFYALSWGALSGKGL